MTEADPRGGFLVDVGRKMLAGAMSATVSKTVQAPMDRVKLLLQLQAASTQIEASTQYKGVLDCIKRIYHEQGIFSFWRGNLANVVRFFPTQAVMFTCKDKYSDFFLQGVSKDQGARRAAGSLAAGGAAGATALVATYPLDFARTRLATDVGGKLVKRQYSGMVDAITRTAREEGVSALYRGFGVALVGVVTWRALYLGGYDVVKARFQGVDEDRPLGVLEKYAAAQVVTTGAGCLIYPLDTTRRRMMMQAGRRDVLYRSTGHCVQCILRTEGLAGFYKGLGANILRGVGGALLLVCYDEIEGHLRRL